MSKRREHHQSYNHGHSNNSAYNHESHHQNNGGHHHHHRHMIEDFKKRFFISTALSIPVLLFSRMIQELLGFEIKFPGMELVAALLSTVIFLYGGWPFLKGLNQELAKGRPGMMTLIGIAISVAWIYSTAVVLGLPGKVFYWELVTLIDIMLLGHWLEMRSIMGASKALEKLAALMPSEAHLIKGDEIMEIKVQELKAEDRILIKPGEKVPADGRIVEGSTEVDESALTGESLPVAKKIGDKVIGGSINTDGSITVEVEASGSQSYLNRVITLVEEAQDSKSHTQHLADRAAGWLVYIAIGVGLITFLVWWIFTGEDLNFALERAVTVMIITCPHALGLAIPLVAAISTGLSAKNGLLIRNRTAFENSRKITSMIFDKTGTLTSGDFKVQKIVSLSEDLNEEDILRFAAALEQNSEHPIARGILRAAEKQELKPPYSSEFQSHTGKGVSAVINEQRYHLASPGYVKEHNMDIPYSTMEETETVVFLVAGRKLLGYISLEDELREESKSAVATLKNQDIEVLMATGDNEKTARKVAERLELDGYYSEVLPHQKADLVKKLQSEGKFVAMTGDGVNDAPALATADVGIAVGSGTDIAAETADIILTESSPRDITDLILFGKATYRKMVQNLIWATGYNIVAIPLAAGVLHRWGIMINPALGAVLMSLSTIICALNAQLLRLHLKK